MKKIIVKGYDITKTIRHGLTPEQYIELMEYQNFECPLSGVKFYQSFHKGFQGKKSYSLFHSSQSLLSSFEQ